MPALKGVITVEELKTYLESPKEEITKDETLKISEYTKKCEEEHKNVDEKNIRKIKEELKSEYERRNQTKDKILSILKECDEISSKIEKVEVAKYMITRADVRRAEKIVQKEIEELQTTYGKNINEILEIIKKIHGLENVENIDFNIYKQSEKLLTKVKEEFKEELSEDERKELFKEKLDNIENIKRFNSAKIPNKVLKNADNEMQAKLSKFMLVRQKRIKIASTMKNDYMKLVEPTEYKIMIEDALEKLKIISDIIEENRYKKINRELIKIQKRIDRSTSEIRYIIGYKEKKLGLEDYNTQFARQNRMENLETEICNANKDINSKNIESLKKQLAETQKTYEKEKQFKDIVSKFEEPEETEKDKNSEELIEEIRKNLVSLQNEVEIAEKIIAEQNKRIEKINEELLVLWKIEIDSTLEVKNNAIALLGNKKEENTKENLQDMFVKAISKLKKMYEEINNVYIKEE